MQPSASNSGSDPAPARRRPAASIRSPLQFLEEPYEGLPRGLSPGIVRRVSETGEPLNVVHRPPPATARLAISPPLSPMEFCRQARRLRASLAHDPKRLHEELSRLAARGKLDREPAAPPPPAAPQPLRLNWTQTAKLGKDGVRIAAKLGRGLSMAAEN